MEEEENSKNRFRVGSGVKKSREQKYLLIGGGGGSGGDGLLVVTDKPEGLTMFPLLELLLVVKVGVRNPSEPEPRRLSLEFN